MIKDIYKINYMRNSFDYVGTLRNENKFNLNDDVFFVVRHNEIARGVIVGIELLPSENPEYSYKIKIPKEIIEYNSMFTYPSENDLKNMKLTCRYIFKSIEEAKNSALEETERRYELQKKEIEMYFKPFTK